MPNINFVPDDYIQNTESRHTNVFCVVLLFIVMSGLMSSFGIIKIRQRACRAQEGLVNAKTARLHEAITQFEELQTKRKEMMKTALTTAQLLEPVPRSIVLASLTNELPAGTSLAAVKFNQKESSASKAAQASRSRAKKAGGGAKGATSDPAKESTDAPKASLEQDLETQIEIVGIAPSDLQVAAYIEHLGNSALVDNVALVESKEKKVEDTTFRLFKLTAMLSKEVHLTKEDVDQIRTKAQQSIYQF